jgi:septum formation protein
MLSHPLVLASQSPRREQILSMLGFAFEIIPPHADETPPPGLEAAAIPEALARVKALAVSGQRPDALVLGSDTLVEIDGPCCNG